MNEYKKCNLCPRMCGVDRTNGMTGFCGATSDVRAARAALHFWEEPCISGESGSGTVFFSGCNMRCVYCQNQEISRAVFQAENLNEEPGRKPILRGRVVSPERLTEIYFELAEKGANNINLVTGDIYLPSIAVSIEKAKGQGFHLPFLLNTSSYVNVDTLRRMDGLIDIYLADMKYIREEDAVRYSAAPGYPDIAKAAIEEMVRQQPACVFSDHLIVGQGDLNSPNGTGEIGSLSFKENEKRMMKKGVIVRHLLLPGMLIQAKMIVKYLYEKYGDSIYISLMNQYTPVAGLPSEKYPELGRRVTEYEYKSLVDYAARLGVTKGFMQIGETAKESFIPAFDCRGI